MVKTAGHPPRQGDLIKLDLDPTLGHEQRGYRPALVVSLTEFNRRTGLCWLVPVTTAERGLPNELRLPAGLGVKGALLLPQLRAIDWRARRFRVAGAVPRDFLEDVGERLGAVLAIDAPLGK